MTTSNIEPDGFLASLESPLKGSSAENEPDLKEVTSRLTELIDNGHLEAAVKAVQLLGTAAGTHGKISKDPGSPVREHG